MKRRGGVLALALAFMAGAWGAPAFGQASPETPSGLVPAGSIEILCPGVACTATISGMDGTAKIPSDSGTVIDGVPGGERVVTVRAGGHRGQVTVDVCGNELTVTATAGGVKATPSECGPFGTVDIAAPKAASVSIAGHALDEKGGQKVAVYAGRVQVVVLLSGFQPFTKTVDVQAGSVTTVAASPQPQPGIVSIGPVTGVDQLSVDGTTVLQHGEVQKSSLDVVVDGTQLKVGLQPGTHVIHAVKPNYQPLDMTEDLQSGQQPQWKLNFEALPAKVTLKVWPAGAQVRLDGTVVDASRTLSVKEGVHTVDATASGFDPVERTFTAKANQQLVVDVTLQGKPVSVVIRGVPMDAKVRVDGGNATSVGSPLKVAPGPHHLTVEAPGYEPATKDVVLSTAIVQWIDVALTKLGRLELAVTPPAAQITIDGKAVDVRPEGTAFDLAPGSHAIAVKAANYASQARTVALVSGKTVQTTIALVPDPAVLDLHGLPEGVSVTLDGKPVDVSGETITIPNPGTHQVRVGSATLTAKTFTVESTPGAQLSLDLGSFQPQPATVTLSPVPPGTKVLLDGQGVQSYEGPIELSAGKHTIWVAADGYTRAKLEFTVKAGQQLTLDPRLKALGN